MRLYKKEKTILQLKLKLLQQNQNKKKLFTLAGENVTTITWLLNKLRCSFLYIRLWRACGNLINFIKCHDFSFKFIFVLTNFEKKKRIEKSTLYTLAEPKKKKTYFNYGNLLKIRRLDVVLFWKHMPHRFNDSHNK